MFDIVLEIGQQPFQCREGIRCFHVAAVPVVALATLVVIPNSALGRRSIKEPVLVSMQTGRYGVRQRPDHHLDDGAVIADFLDLDEGARSFVLHHSNTVLLSNNFAPSREAVLPPQPPKL